MSLIPPRRYTCTSRSVLTEMKMRITESQCLQSARPLADLRERSRFYDRSSGICHRGNAHLHFGQHQSNGSPNGCTVFSLDSTCAPYHSGLLRRYTSLVV